MMSISYYLGFGIKCSVCGRGQILKNTTSDIYFGGRCRNETDLGAEEQSCPWEENTYCLKWQLSVNPAFKTTIDFMAALLSNKEQLEALSNQTIDKLGQNLDARE